mmetsp:Transcript_45526/g.95583  ORF Transcript_45526/g.95583 Transcript_45526/m.95583 type:complete len:239 (-) Transcript_45526:821-1537(-)
MPKLPAPQPRQQPPPPKTRSTPTKCYATWKCSWWRASSPARSPRCTSVPRAFTCRSRGVAPPSGGSRCRRRNARRGRRDDASLPRRRDWLLPWRRRHLPRHQIALREESGRESIISTRVRIRDLLGRRNCRGRSSDRGIVRCRMPCLLGRILIMTLCANTAASNNAPPNPPAPAAASWTNRRGRYSNDSIPTPSNSKPTRWAATDVCSAPRRRRRRKRRNRIRRKRRRPIERNRWSVH